MSGPGIVTLIWERQDTEKLNRIKTSTKNVALVLALEEVGGKLDDMHAEISHKGLPFRGFQVTITPSGFDSWEITVDW